MPYIILRYDTGNYLTSNSRKCNGVNREALLLHVVSKKLYIYCKSRENPYQYDKSCKNLYRYYKSRENPYQVQQVTHAASEHAMKLKVHMIKSLPP